MSAHTPGAGGSHPYHLDPPFVQATYAGQSCGCQIVGNGTIPHPLDVKRCPTHASARELLAAAKAMLEPGAHGWEQLRAAIAKAEAP